MNAHLYLHYSSYHPAHQKNSIPYSQAIRLRHICSTTDHYWAAANQLYCNLTNRGYPKKLVKLALDKAFDKDRHNLLIPNINKTSQLRTDIPFIIQFNPQNPLINPKKEAAHTDILGRYQIHVKLPFPNGTQTRLKPETIPGKSRLEIDRYTQRFWTLWQTL